MGLDMYLYKKHYVKNWDHNPKDYRYSFTVKRGGKNVESINKKRIAYIIEEVACWRKFNALHAWFVNVAQDGNDDCKEYWVSRDDLIQLLILLRRIDENHELAETLLPTQEGFFFGPTAYDECYFIDVKDTINVLKELLDEDNSDDYYYRSSW